LGVVLTGLPVSGFPAPLPAAAHFSAADFFRDCPWLNVPAHRKAEILVEPLYPRLGLLGGAPESGGKMSKLAALAAARKKKEGEKAATAPEGPPTPKPVRSEASTLKPSGTPLSLSERLAASKLTKASEANGSLRRLGKPSASTSLPARQQPPPEDNNPPSPSLPEPTKQEEPEKEPEQPQPTPNIRASPSTFASVILGNAAGPTIAEPSHLNSNNMDLLQIYGQDHAEPFDFAAPSPDDVVMNAQSTAKGLAIRRKG
jgi:elongation factor 1 alpha-like protein